MLLLGLLLLAAGVGTGAWIATQNTDTTSFDVFGQEVTDLSLGGVLGLGMVLGALTLLGLWLLSAGIKQARRRGLERQHEAAMTRSRVDELEQENVRLRDQVGRRAAMDADGYTEPGNGLLTARDSRYGSDAASDTSRSLLAEETRPIVLGDSASNVVGGEQRETVYPDEPAGEPRNASTPAFEQDAREHQQDGRVFGRPT